MKLKKSAFLAVIIFAIAILLNTSVLAETVSGIVFLDVDKDGVKDAEDSGVGGVMVSDGEDVTKSSPTGAYSFTFSLSGVNTRFVFATTPTGYRFTTPWYIKIESGGGPGYTMNFGVTPDTTPSNVAGSDFNFIAGSDIQYDVVSSETEFRYDWQTMEDLTGSIDIGFATWAGDLTPLGILTRLQKIREVEDDVLSYPSYNGFGGHDALRPEGIDNWEEALGPYYYSWDYAGRHFITIVSEYYQDGMYIPTSEWNRQRIWIFNDLAQVDPGTGIFVVTHMPENIDSTLDTIASIYNLIGILRGHLHNTYSYRSGSDNIPVLCSAPIRSADLGVFTKLPRVVSISGDNISSQIIPLGQEKRLIGVSPTPDGIEPKSSEVLILANAFNSGSKISSVKYSLTGPSGAVATDVALAKSTWWSWRGTWDASSATAGDYTLDLTATDDQSDSWQKTIQFELSDDQSPTPVLGQDWPALFGPDNQNRYTSDDPLGQLRLLWASPVGSTDRGAVLFSSPVVVDGKVFVGAWDPDNDSPEGGVVAFDALTGQRLWKVGIGAVFHTPAVSNGKVYALSSHGILNCIDIATQVVDWTYDLYAGKDYDYRLAQAPVMVVNGKVYTIGDYTNAYCLNASTGSMIWSKNVSSSTVVISAVYVSGSAAYFISQYDIYAFNADTGATLYTTALASRQRRNGSPVVYNNVLYTSYQNSIAAYDITNNCSEIWRILEGGSNYVFGMPVYRDGKIYYSEGTSILCRDAANGSEVWRLPTSDAALFVDSKYQKMLEPSSHALTASYDYVGSDNGSFYVLDAESGAVVSQFFFGPPVKSSATISGNMVFIGCTDGNLYAFGPAIVPQSAIERIAPAVVIEWEGNLGIGYDIYWREDASDTWQLADTVVGVTGTNRWIDAGGPGRPEPKLENPVVREYQIESNN